MTELGLSITSNLFTGADGLGHCTVECNDLPFRPQELCILRPALCDETLSLGVASLLCFVDIDQLLKVTP